LADFVRAVEIQPRSLPGWRNRASVLAGLRGKTPEAVAALDRVNRLVPDHAPTLASRGILNARLGKDAAALEDARSALALAKGAPATLFQVAGIYALCSRHDVRHRERGIRLLAAALRGGYGHSRIATEADLKPLRGDARFTALVAAARTLHAGSAPDATKALAGR
jgi:tetratricopeptide (TPR) repeat protein